MFTIKHEDGNGRIQLVSAKRFSAEVRSDGNTQFLAFNEFGDDYEATWCGIEASAITTDVIYVMNDRGSTVAVHRFNRPDFSEVVA